MYIYIHTHVLVNIRVERSLNNRKETEGETDNREREDKVLKIEFNYISAQISAACYWCCNRKNGKLTKTGQADRQRERTTDRHL